MVTIETKIRVWETELSTARKMWHAEDPAMEDFRFDFTVDTGMRARVVTLGVKPFALIGATTRPSLLSSALRSRFGITHHLGFYEQPELLAILHRSAAILNMDDVSAEAMSLIASRSRGTPRVANRLLRRVRDFAQVRAAGRIDPEVIDEALALDPVLDVMADN